MATLQPDVPDAAKEKPSQRESAIRIARPLVIVWLSFLVYSFWQAPIPAVNEPHWLAKAKHFWQPDWCQEDFFLKSSNTHRVFYQTVGAMTRLCSLETTAVIGRVIGYLILAVGWTSLCRCATGDERTAFPAAWIFLLLASIGNLSGEWLVSGIEGKVFSYGFMFLSLTRLAEAEWLKAGVYGGLGIAFHPLAGLWVVIATAMAVAMAAILPDHSLRQSLLTSLSVLRQPRAVAGIVAASVLSLAGVLPALDAVGGASPEQVRTATYLQVFHRLGHHLDPMEFDAWRYGLYLLMAVSAWLLIRLGSRRAQMTWLGRVVLASGIIATVGWLIGYRDPSLVDLDLPARMPLYNLRASLLKFYPFRLVDILLPVLLAFLLARHATSRLAHFYPRPLAAVFLMAITVTLWLSAGKGSVNRMDGKQESDWREACEWIRQHTPATSVVHTPRQSWAFKWFAQRAEYVALKDCPQDAAGIVEWNNRLQGIREWAVAAYDDEVYSKEDVESLWRATGITHLLVRRLGPFQFDPEFRTSNRIYRVYRITPDPLPGRTRY